MTDAPPPEPPQGAHPRPGPPDPPRAPGGGHRGNTLGLRLALAFLGVALAAVALIAVLTAVFSAADVSSLASRQREELAGAFAVAAGSAWQQHQSWAGADLKPLINVAAETGVRLQVRDAARPYRGGGHGSLHCGGRPRPVQPVVVQQAARRARCSSA